MPGGYGRCSGVDGECGVVEQDRVVVSDPFAADVELMHRFVCVLGSLCGRVVSAMPVRRDDPGGADPRVWSVAMDGEAVVRVSVAGPAVWEASGGGLLFGGEGLTREIATLWGVCDTRREVRSEGPSR